ncbi:MAG: ABC transporter permease [Thermodesulfobacteriota bacterium]
MMFADLLLISLRQVLRQHRRNIGVVLAIALGTAGFFLIITTGRDVKIKFNHDLDILGGATRIKVYFPGAGDLGGEVKPEWFRDRTVRALRTIPGVNAVTQVLTKVGYAFSYVTWKNQPYYFHIMGVDDYFWDVNSFIPAQGRFFTADELNQGRKVCVIGEELVSRLFGRENPLGALIPVDYDLYEVIGVLGGAAAAERNSWCFIPLTTARNRLFHADVLRILYVRCKTWDDVESVAAAIPKKVEANQDGKGLTVEVAWERLDKVKKVSWLIELFIYVAVIATLLLGGFGIWNIMMMGVQARTREIGLKKAMGAEDRDILSQFLTEALCLSLLASLVGIVVGRALIELVAHLLGSRVLEDIFLLCVALDLLFAVVIGVAAGLSPSIRASRMEVVSAVRYE